MLSKGRRVIPFSLLSLAVGLIGFGALLLARFPPDYSADTPGVEVLSETETAAATTAAPTTTEAPATTEASTTSSTTTSTTAASTSTSTTSPTTTTAAPDESEEPTATTVAPTTVSVGPTTYRVERGDTLNELSARFGVPVSELVSLNSIADPDLIFTGQVLRISVGGEQQVEFGIAGFDTEPFIVTAAAVDLEPELLEAVAWVASGWDPEVVDDGIGIGQLDPEIHTFVERDLVGRELDATDTDDSVEAMGQYLAWLFAQAGGETSSALAAYYEDLLTARNIAWTEATLDFVDAVRTARRQFVLAAN